VVVGILVVLLIVVAILFPKVTQKAALMRGITSPEASLSVEVLTAVPTQVLMTVPTLAPEPKKIANSLPVSSYEIVIAVDNNGEHPDGELSYSTSGITCMGGCGVFKGILELRGIRVLDQGFVLDLNVTLSEVSGDPWLFSADLKDIILEINGQMFMPKGSSFPTKVTSSGSMIGYLSFSESIPINADGQYKVVLTISNRLQPVEGWLIPK